MKKSGYDMIMNQLLKLETSYNNDEKLRGWSVHVLADIAVSLERIADSLDLENKRLSMKPDPSPLMQNLISLLTGFIVVGKEENSENADFTPPKREATF